MKKKYLKVTMCSDKNFFDNVFEPKRRSIQKQLGLPNLTQVQFTSMIEDIKVKININKPRTRIPKKNFKFKL